MSGLAAVALEGPRGVGKTATAARRASTTFSLDREADRQITVADPSSVVSREKPVFIDEWQRSPPIWDHIRHQVDQGAAPGSYLLAASSIPTDGPVHSGAGRIVVLRMRPMTLAERGVTEPTVSLRELMTGQHPKISGETNLGLPFYAEEIVRSGLPGLRNVPDRLRAAQLEGYLTRIVERDIEEEQGRPVRRPETLRRWLMAYAAATSSTATYEAIMEAATAGVGNKPAKATTIAYRDALTRLWLLDPIPGWHPSPRTPLARVTQAPKHHLADPALAARLLNLEPAELLDGATGGVGPGPAGGLLGAFFESLVTLDVRGYAQAIGPAGRDRVQHLRTRNGLHEVDLIVEGAGLRVLAIEIKLTSAVNDDDVRHLRWLQNQLGGALLDAMIVTTGHYAYRRHSDGIAVVPAALLGP